MYGPAQECATSIDDELCPDSRRSVRTLLGARDCHHPEHGDDGHGHHAGRDPAQDLEARADHKPAHDCLPAGHDHHDHHDRYRDHAVDHRAPVPVSYTHLRAHETDSYLVC